MITIRAIEPSDFEAWSQLYDGYAEFYRVPMNDDIKSNLWGWLMDQNHETEGLIALLDGEACGLAHFRRMPSPLRGMDIGFLDDLFITPTARGNKIGQALFDELAKIAKDKGWSKIRWITADDNYRARALYDQLSTKTMWNTYEMEI